jgi:site-specific DNA-adenine methylase
LEQASAALQGVQLQQGDFVRVACTEPAFIYADPPYPVVASSFAHYTSGGFAWAEHEFLHRRVRQWVAQGHKVLLSYPDLLAIRELYADFSIAKVQGSRAIAANGNRKPVAELLLRSYTS